MLNISFITKYAYMEVGRIYTYFVVKYRRNAWAYRYSRKQYSRARVRKGGNKIKKK